MTTFTVRLRSRQDIAHGTTAFQFDKPAEFSFKPGRMRNSPFKNALARLPIGAPIQVEGPFGSLTLHTRRSGAPSSSGVIGPDLLRRAAEGVPNPVWYVAGPPAMVAGLRATLGHAGLDDDDIRSEEFYGY